MGSGSEFQPDWISPPGDTISDLMEKLEISGAELSERLGCEPTYVNDLLHGRVPLTANVATALELRLGAPADFWLAREAQYRDDLRRLCRTPSPTASTEWTKSFPVRDLVRLGWIHRTKGIDESRNALLSFFGVADIASWEQLYGDVLHTFAFRTSPRFLSQLGAVAAWVRRGEIEASKIECAKWDPSRFRQNLVQLRGVTREKDPQSFIREVQVLCAAAGVAVVVLPAPAGCRASGATRFLSDEKALLLLSFRYLSDDHFWFSFYHEAGHLLLHSGRSFFVEGPETALMTEEQEANEFAAETLIPAAFIAELMNLPTNYRSVMRFARRIGVSPGIVVGQLQHHNRVGRDKLNRLKRRYRWATSHGTP